MKRDYPATICRDCGYKHGYHSCGVASWYPGQCEVCGAFTVVTQPRDYGHLRESWKWEEFKESLVIPEDNSGKDDIENYYSYKKEISQVDEYDARLTKVTHIDIHEIKHNPYDGIIDNEGCEDFPEVIIKAEKKHQWLSMIQVMNDDLSKRNGFTVDHASVFRMVPEVGELVDAVLKYEGMKKIKSTDSIDNQMEEIRDGIGDVLVLLAQVATYYNIDMQEAYLDSYYLVSQREYHN